LGVEVGVGESVTQVINVILPLTAVCIISVMVDVMMVVLEKVMHDVPKLPDHFEWPIAYVLIVLATFYIFWQGNFDLFTYFGLSFNHAWQGYLMTSLVVSGGSVFIRKQFDTINTIPAGFSSVTASLKKIIRFPTPDDKKESAIESLTSPPKTVIEETSGSGYFGGGGGGSVIAGTSSVTNPTSILDIPSTDEFDDPNRYVIAE